MPTLVAGLLLALTFSLSLLPAPHGTVVAPLSRVYRVYQSNPENPNFALAANAVRIDGTSSYYTWNEVSRNIPQAVRAGLPPAFDYSPWIPDGQLASAGRVDRQVFGRTYAGLDQVSADWPTTPVRAGQNLRVEFLATAPHNPSVWDVWMTTADWNANTALNWRQMQFLGRPNVTFANNRYTFDVAIPADRRGHQVLWVVWQRNDPVGEAFFSTCDIDVRPANDECDGAAPLRDFDNPPVDTRGASRSAAAAPCESGTSADLWFSYRATCTGTLRVETCANAPTFDSVVSLWTGSCPTPTLLACNDDGCGTLSAATASVQRNATYWIKVGWRGAAPPTIALTLSYANGTGSFVDVHPGCGGAQLTATGAANPGGLLNYALAPRGAAQVLWLGMNLAPLPLCPSCDLGTDFAAVWPTATLRTFLPCDATLVGAHWFTQAADLGVGACQLGGAALALSNTVRTSVGN